MYCSSCGSAVGPSLSYCNRCGAKVSGAKGDAAVRSSELKPESLVASMVALFIFGLGAIAVLVGVLKAVAGFDLPILLAVTVFSFFLLLVVEGVLIGLLLRSRRESREAGGTGAPKELTTRDLGEAPARALTEGVPSVTEHATRTFEPLYSERKSD